MFISLIFLLSTYFVHLQIYFVLLQIYFKMEQKMKRIKQKLKEFQRKLRTIKEEKMILLRVLEEKRVKRMNYNQTEYLNKR